MTTKKNAVAVIAFFTLPFAAVLAEQAAVNAPEAWVAPARAARKENPVAADAAAVEKGKALYLQACMPCHGTTGKGDGPAAAALIFNGKAVHPRNLTDPKMHDQTDGALFWKISEGRTLMPRFQEIFSDEQRWTVINYVRTLAPKDTHLGAEKTNGEKP